MFYILNKTIKKKIKHPPKFLRKPHLYNLRLHYKQSVVDCVGVCVCIALTMWVIITP